MKKTLKFFAVSLLFVSMSHAQDTSTLSQVTGFLAKHTKTVACGVVGGFGSHLFLKGTDQVVKATVEAKNIAVLPSSNGAVCIAISQARIPFLAGVLENYAGDVDTTSPTARAELVIGNILGRSLANGLLAKAGFNK